MDELLIGGTYQIKEVIYEGPCSAVYIGEHRLKGTKVIIKMEENNKYNLLKKESSIYLELQKNKIKKISPEFKNFGIISNYNYLILEKMECNLKEKYQGKKLSISEVCNIGIQLIKLVEVLHNNGLLHRDIKLENFIYNKEKIYIIDYGLSQFIGNTEYKYNRGYENYIINKDIMQYYNNTKNTNKFIGNKLFSSYNVHNGYDYLKKDDLISIMYILFYLYFKKLPWDNLHLTNEEVELDIIGNLKKYFNYNVFYKGIEGNEYLINLYNIIRYIECTDKIDYELYIEKLLTIKNEYR